MTTTTVHRTCTICEATCGISVEVDAGRRAALRVVGDRDDPFSAGHVCPKVHAMGALLDDPDRLRTPVRRTERGFEPIGWDEALEFAARGLARVRDAHGVDAIALYRGNPTVHDAQSILYWNALQRALPTRNQFSAGSLDTWPRFVQAGLMYGGFLNTPVPDVDRTDYFLMLGANPLASHGSLMTAPGMRRRLDALRARGGTLVVVDPRRSETAARADEHVAVRPGGDAALVLGMVHCLFEEGLVDLGRAAPWVRGVDDVRALVARHAPEAVSGACGVPAADIRRLARAFAAAPSAVAYGRMGTCVQSFGTLASWAIDLLNVLTGNLDRPGGAMFPEPAVSLAFAGPGKDGTPPYGRWQSRVGGRDEIQGELPMAAFAEEMEAPGDGQVRALVIIAGNPVVSAPNARRIDRALAGLEHMVAFDYYLNETTRHAHVVLPPTPPLANDTYDLALLHFAVRNVAKWSPAAIEPEDGTRPVWRSLLDLAKQLLGAGALTTEQADDLVLRQVAEQALPRSRFRDVLSVDEVLAGAGGEAGPRRAIDVLLRIGPYGDGFGREPGGLSVERLEESVHGVDLGALAPRLPGAIQTPSGSIELAPERIVRDLPRLDRFLADAARDDRVLLIGRRDVRSMNSWLHNLPSLAKGSERCTLLVHPDDAARHGLAQGGLARVEGRVGAVVARVEVDDAMRPGVASLPHGWGHDLPGVELAVARRRPGVNANAVVDDALVDVPSGTSVLNGIPVALSPVPGL
ncbi:MAG: molybdopterin-dependent oxidoreductase [Myxococcota bacterium]